MQSEDNAFNGCNPATAMLVRVMWLVPYKITRLRASDLARTSEQPAGPSHARSCGVSTVDQSIDRLFFIYLPMILITRAARLCADHRTGESIRCRGGASAGHP